MGCDAFGFAAEQHAIKTDVNSVTNMANNIAVFEMQVKRVGFMIDCDKEINTIDPSYFK
jgi:leucyl-tRNA synthetase